MTSPSIHSIPLEGHLNF